jgi:hypothetical protein
MTPASPTPPIVELVEELRRREDAWHAEERALASLRTAVMSAAERQAGSILQTARDDIRRIVVNARCELLALLDCVQIVNAPEGDHSTGDAPASEPPPVTTLIEARHAVRGILGEARSGLEQLESDARVAGLAPARESVGTIMRREDADPSGERHARESRGLTESRKAGFTSLILGVVIVTSGAAWSFRSELQALVHSNATVKRSPPESALLSSRPFVPTAATLPDRSPSVLTPDEPSPLPEELVLSQSAQTLALAAAGRDENRRLRQVETSPGRSTSSAPGIASSPGLASSAGALSSGSSSSAAIAPSPAVESSTSVASSGSLQTSTDTDATRAALTSAASRWLEAYYQKGADGNAALMREVSVSDSRRTDHRPPAGIGPVRRTLDRVDIQFTNDAAVVTGRVTERADVGGQPREWVSWLSQVWLLERGKWRLIDMRLVGNEQLK